MEEKTITIEALQAELNMLKQSNERLEKAFMAVSMIMEKQLLTKETSKKDSLTREFERKLRKSRPHVLKDKIIRYFEDTSNSDLADAKFHFVEQMSYTSKATFYRYISELIREGKIAKSTNGKITMITPIMNTN